ncbi:Myotubularin-like protein [Melia azedarach]|uniref:Myotubularin-like protein n=1 Tax=Melia azedarach TaxID=155640 RepID=A0ACC1WSG7_MELAZ|nr:Myotubularin-like protein [Melia azedarach]
MLCSRTSIKDVTQLPRLDDRCSASFSSDPLSPKIGCMGQVKRNNKIIGFPSVSHGKLTLATTKSNNNDVKYFKLKRLFSGRNIVATSNNINASSCAVNSCRRREAKGNNSVSKMQNKEDGSKERSGDSEVSVNIAEMDPPLPVIKRVPKAAADEGEGNANNLWKRRSGVGALKGLELQQIKIPRHHQVEITTV